jgi:alpha-glucosidase (family GH31 glycosyl hydrolase)
MRGIGALCASPPPSADIGGFMQPVDGELLVRWVQLGALSPVFRTHGVRDIRVEKRLWYYDQQV